MLQKLGRNDRCHCGSGLKYKKCCLTKDEASNVTRITDSKPSTWGDIVDHEMQWPNELHRMIALHFIHHTLDIYKDEEIESLVFIWNMFVHEENPITKKLGVYPAALEYVLTRIFQYDTTQKELAEKYDISVATLSQRANQLFDFIEKQQALDSQSIPTSGVTKLSSFGNAESHIHAEQEMARIHALLEEQEFDSIEDINAFLEQNMNNSPENKIPESKEGQAMDLVYQAWDETNVERRMKLAQDALLLDPHSVDAYNIFAECAASPKEQAYYYKQGMQVGEKHFGEAFFKENMGHFWGYLPTRPYMRAKKGYAEICALLDNMAEAIKHFRELLELNPNDNQGVRELLLSAYIETMDWKSAKQLIEQYDEDYSASFYYGRVLVEHGMNGASSKLTSLIKKATEQNPYVPSYLLGKKQLPNELPEFIGLGDDREAIVYATMNRHFWVTRPELLQLLPDR